jgi:hypothetical protein
MVLFSEFGNLTSLLLVVLAITAGLLLMRTNRYFAQQRRQAARRVDGGHGHPEAPRRYAQTPEAVARWEVEMHDRAREIAGQIDSKMSGLQSLIAEADRAAARLEAATARADELQHLRGHQVDSLGAGAASNGSSPPTPSADRSRRHEEVYTLADYGYSAADIAGRLGMPVGEIELILSLRGKA